ncbi:MAG: TolC family protein [Cytophagales bacterium]
MKDDFSLQELYRSMLQNHPVVKQAQLLSEQAKQEILMARGAGFDPKLQSTWDKKSFDGKDYFNIWQNSLKIPTWFGVEFKAGYEEIYGIYVNPERTIPTNGQSYIGVSVPLGQGLFIDSRRATLRLAQQARNINEAEKIKMINKVLYEAAKDYWEWYFKYFRYKNLQNGYNLALERYSFVKSRVLIGEEASIDSTEALILLQTRYITFSAAQMEWQNAAIMLSNHIWGDENTPLELDTTTIPQSIIFPLEIVSNEEYAALGEFAKKNHPEILKINFKINQLNIERRLALESIKPTVNLSYNLLQAGQNPVANYDSKYFQNNYKAGVDVNFPLLWRKERGKLNLTKAKIKSTEFERVFTSRQIQNQLQSFYNELKNTEMLLLTQSRLVNNYTILRQGEYEKFKNGESSLFLVNSRETSLIDSQIKLAEMESKYQKSKASLYWSAGKTEAE